MPYLFDPFRRNFDAYMAIHKQFFALLCVSGAGQQQKKQEKAVHEKVKNCYEFNIFSDECKAKSMNFLDEFLVR